MESPRTRVPEETTELPLLLAMVFRAITDEVHERLAADGHERVRPAHGFTLGYLTRGNGATAGELAAHLGITKQGAAQLLTELEADGYVSRRPHPTDGRSRLVALTPRGRAVVDRVHALWRDIETHWSAQIGADRLDDTRTALQQYLRASGRPNPLRPAW